MMDKDEEKFLVNSHDHLYHILVTDTFMFCLICFKDICSNRNDGVRKHLNSPSHIESVKCLFKACNPSLIDVIEDERFVEIVSRSVFDISVLLGKESSYVSKKDGHWFCLMCEQNISQCNLADAVIKDDIIDHVLSNSHVKNVKEVCFLYRLNANQDFLLLNKSVVYCSVCKDVLQCREVDLLETAAAHLEMKHTNYAISYGFQCEISSSFENEKPKTEEGSTDEKIPSIHLDSKYEHGTEEMKKEIFHELVLNHVDLAGTVGKVPSYLNLKKSTNGKGVSKEVNVCICLLCKKRMTTCQNVLLSINKHFRRAHKRVYVKTSLENLINNSVTFHNEPDYLKLMSESRSMGKSFKKLIKKTRKVNNHLNYIVVTKTHYVCIFCLVSISPCLDDNSVVLQHLEDHFNSHSHYQCKEEITEINQTFYEKSKKTIALLKKKKDQFKEKDLRKKAKKKVKRDKAKLRKNQEKKVSERRNKKEDVYAYLIKNLP